MTITLLNPRTNKTEVVHLPFAQMANTADLNDFYLSRGLVIVEIRYDFVSL